MKPAQEIFEVMERTGCRQITFHFNPTTKLKLVWVIDSLPEKRDAAGKLVVSTSCGTRSAHQDADSALDDAIRLARAMT